MMLIVGWTSGHRRQKMSSNLLIHDKHMAAKHAVFGKCYGLLITVGSFASLCSYMRLGERASSALWF